MKQRQAVTAVTVRRYRQGSKKVKQQILDEFCETTGYCRDYARYVLRKHGRQVWLDGKRTIVGDVCKRQQRLGPRVYDEQVLAELKRELDKQRKELFRLAAKKRPVRPKRHATKKT